MKVSKILKKLRTKTGLNQTQFGEKVDLEQNRISRYENEVDRISLEMFLNWCEVFNVDPKDVL